MSNTKKNKNTKDVHKKKILDGIDVVKENNLNDENKNVNFDDIIKNIRKDIIEEELQKGKEIKEEKRKENTANINDKIQSFISILFTIIIFIAMILLIIVLYNNYIKKDNNNEIDKEKICSEYIKKDYNIKEDEIISFVRNTRSILYNIEEFERDKITNQDLLNISKYIIWGSDQEYLECNNEENCLDTKKEFNYHELERLLKEYLNLEDINLIFYNEFMDDDKTRLYLNQDKVILTFKEMEIETYKHDIVDINIDENNIIVIYALSEKINNYYNYIGSKKVYLKYINNKFIIDKIKTNIN